MIYRLDYESRLSLDTTDDYSIFKIWKNPAPIDDWQPLALTYSGELPDVIGLRSIMLWAGDKAQTFQSTDYQALPVTINGIPYYAIHITHVLDCLDQNQSQFKRFKNRNIGVEHYVLRADCIGDVSLFTIPDDGYSAIFATDDFKAWVSAQGWTGLSFFEVQLS